jgi:hypothetical protein
VAMTAFVTRISVTANRNLPACPDPSSCPRISGDGR